MCGIAGVFGRNEEHVVRAMLARLIHRGPDDEHAVSGDNFSFGARRLSIVGVLDGRQPLSDPDETVWACQNGELYNYPEIQKHLISKGHRFRTHCDTEVLPHLYQEYGLDVPLHIDGMFAIAIWDKKQQIGLLARDRMGKKPLYYFENNGAVYFASEIKALLTVPGFERKIDPEALSYFFSFKHVPCPRTIFSGIKVLPPGHLMVFRPDRAVEIRRYWALDFSSDKSAAEQSEDSLVEELIRLLKQGVKRRLMSDVPIGFFLSGGIDSSLSTAIAAEMSDKPLKTFTLTYSNQSTTDGKELDRKWARFTAAKYATDHHEETVEFSHFPDNLRRIIGCFDEPFAGTISTYFLAGLIAKHVKVALSGDGADELFGSYLSHRLALPLSRYPEYLRTGQANLIEPFSNQTELLARLYEPEDWSWRSKLMMHTDSEKVTLFSQEFALAANGVTARELLRQDFSQLTADDPLNRILEAEYKTIFPDQVLAFVDRLSMAHSLEVRSAFMDTDLVKFAARLPGDLKFKNGETKYLLKRAALKYLPEEMVFRKKEGFVMPITEWLLHDLQDYVRETLSPGRLGLHNIFNTERVDELVNDLYTKPSDYTHANKVLSLIVFQEWYEHYMLLGTDAHSSMVPAELLR